MIVLPVLFYPLVCKRGWYGCVSRKMSLNYALGLLMYSCRFCS